MYAIRKKLSATEGDPSDKRYNPDTEEVETTVDGGEIWTPNPGADPRNDPTKTMPPVSDTGNCGAAAGMIVEMKKWIAIAATGGTVASLATLILSGLVFLIPGVGWLWAAVLGLSGGLVLAGSVTIAAAFTPEVWEELLCILVNNIAADGSVNQEQLDAIRADIAADFGGDIEIGTNLIFQTWGFVGLSNAGVRGYDAEADCSACVVGWCYEFDFTVDDGGWVADTYGTWVSGEGWQYAPSPSAIIIQKNFIAPNSLRTVMVETSNSGGAGVQILLTNTGTYVGVGATQPLDAGDATDPLIVDTTTAELSNIVYNGNADEASTVYLRKMTIWGDFGDNPFGESNCE